MGKTAKKVAVLDSLIFESKMTNFVGCFSHVFRIVFHIFIGGGGGGEGGSCSSRPLAKVSGLSPQPAETFPPNGVSKAGIGIFPPNDVSKGAHECKVRNDVID